MPSCLDQFVPPIMQMPFDCLDKAFDAADACYATSFILENFLYLPYVICHFAALTCSRAL